MTLEQLVIAVKENDTITSEMYHAALVLIKNIQEEYTLQQYTSLLYVLGKYKDTKALTTYMGLRIDEAINKKMFKITKESYELDEKIVAYRDEIKLKVNTVMKVIEKRFINVNAVMALIVLLVLQFLVRTNIIVSVLITAMSFMFNMFTILPKSKKTFLSKQMQELRTQLSEDIQNFENEIY